MLCIRRPCYLRFVNLVQSVSLRMISSQSRLHLNSRSVISVTGVDKTQFLHGLTTNDVNQLDSVLPDGSCQYCFFLNAKGRILGDAFIHKLTSDEFLVEVDQRLSASLLAHFKIYRLRKKVDLNITNLSVDVVLGKDRPPGNNEDLLCVRDPRLDEFEVWRILTNNPSSAEDTEYHRLRFSSGIPEGSLDLPPMKCFPMQSNGDILNALSFDKGCYLGQELTARTHYTGVIRKRIMPVKFEEGVSPSTSDLDVITESGKSVGTLLDWRGNTGIALLRIKQALEQRDKLLTKCSLVLRTWLPSHWTRLKVDIEN